MLPRILDPERVSQNRMTTTSHERHESAGGGERAASESLLRSAVLERVAETSLRNAAREIGMSPPGLKLFLLGGSPRSKTLEKIRAWHLAHGSEGPSVDAARGALRLLVCQLPTDERVPVGRLMLAVLAYLHRRRGSRRPRWLAPLREEYGMPGEMDDAAPVPGP